MTITLQGQAMPICLYDVHATTYKTIFYLQLELEWNVSLASLSILSVFFSSLTQVHDRLGSFSSWVFVCCPSTGADCTFLIFKGCLPFRHCLVHCGIVLLLLRDRNREQNVLALCNLSTPWGSYSSLSFWYLFAMSYLISFFRSANINWQYIYYKFIRK